MKLFYEDIDKPGLNTLAVYEKAGGYKMLTQGAEDGARRGARRAPGLRACAAAAAPASRWARRRPSSPTGTMDKYLVCNADESEPGTFKDRELMQKNPHLLIEGMIIAAYAAGINRSFIYIRGEYEHQADVLEAALEEARAGRLPRRAHPQAPTSRSTWSCTAAPAPTSAARRPRCSTRSRASAATRA